MSKKILRVIDANHNRCKEGLRVIEDIFRFIHQDNTLRKNTRHIRHAIDKIRLSEAINARDCHHDLGKKTDILEIKRKNSREILFANLQRVKESLRVLEEFFKIASPHKVSDLKSLRYKAYTLEKKIITKYPFPNDL
ncbi:MAG: thiamine-phosphate pyrophosphorylase [Candidatus Omnitrophica bacterium]|nr:thiamine-phosphate pyrophosphorylase [Candidatus Omnitrophota bacterium]